MVSGADDPQLAETALALGAYGYIVKPFRDSEVNIGIANALRRRRLEIENKAHHERLEQLVAERTAELDRSREETIHRLAAAAELRDNETGQHIERVSRYCELIARRLGLPHDRCELIRIASPLHDIGKIAIPDHILRKPAPLSAEERRVVETHTDARPQHPRRLAASRCSSSAPRSPGRTTSGSTAAAIRAVSRVTRSRSRGGSSPSPTSSTRSSAIASTASRSRSRRSSPRCGPSAAPSSTRTRSRPS